MVLLILILKRKSVTAESLLHSGKIAAQVFRVNYELFTYELSISPFQFFCLIFNVKQPSFAFRLP